MICEGIEEFWLNMVPQLEYSYLVRYLDLVLEPVSAHKLPVCHKAKKSNMHVATDSDTEQSVFTYGLCIQLLHIYGFSQ